MASQTGRADPTGAELRTDPEVLSCPCIESKGPRQQQQQAPALRGISSGGDGPGAVSQVTTLSWMPRPGGSGQGDHGTELAGEHAYECKKQPSLLQRGIPDHGLHLRQKKAHIIYVSLPGEPWPGSSQSPGNSIVELETVPPVEIWEEICDHPHVKKWHLTRTHLASF